MALNDFQEKFDNSYQEIFQKVLVSKPIANSRFMSELTYGESLERFAYDISGVQVRDVTRGSASTIDTITDSTELIQVNIEKEATFHLSDGEMTQAGPLSPGEVIGGKVAKKVAIDLDARFFGEVSNANNTFDTGDLTTLASTGTPITLSNTTVPQMVARMNAKLQYAENIDTSSNMALVVDAYAVADIEEYLLSKNIDLAGATFRNGYAGSVNGAEVYVSNNLTGEVVLGLATNPTDGDTITVNGIVFTFEATLATAGGLHIGSAVDATRANAAVAMNAIDTAIAEATDTGYQVLSAADQATWNALQVTATDSASADTLTLVCKGAGRLIVSETLTDGTDTFESPFIHSYFGKKGAIDLVTQDVSPVDVRKTADRRGSNIFSSYLAGIKTFADGAKQFLDVKIIA
jgi:hypothetical protein